MMKEISFRPLLLLLLLAVPQRNSCANQMVYTTRGEHTTMSSLTVNATRKGEPANMPSSTVNGRVGEVNTNISSPTVDGATEGALANISSPTVNDLMEGVKLLTDTFTWLQGNMLSSNFHETTSNMAQDISDLPSELAVNRRRILSGLYRSRDRVYLAKSKLEGAANRLKGYCDAYISIIDSYDSYDDSERLLHYFIVREMIKNLQFVNNILEDVLNKFKEIRNIYSSITEYVNDFDTTLLNAKDQMINEMKENNVDMQGIIIDDLELKQIGISDKLNDLIKNDLDLKQQESTSNELKDETLVVCTGNLGVLCPLTVTNVSHIAAFSQQAVIIGNCNYRTPNLYGYEIWINVLVEQYEAVDNWGDLPTEQADLVAKWKDIIRQIANTIYSCGGIPAEQAVAIEKWQNLRSKFDKQNSLTINIEEQNDLLNKINKAQNSISAVLSEVIKINAYIEKESGLITKRHNSLNASISDHEDISIIDIEYSFNGIRDGIIDLKNACVNYLKLANP